MRMGRVGVWDWGIGVGVAAVLVITGWSAPGVAPAAYLLPAAGGLALVARRLAPRAVLAVTGVCAVGAQAAGLDLPAVAYLVAVYTAMRAGHRWVVVGASVALLLTLPFADMLAEPGGAAAESFAHAGACWRSGGWSGSPARGRRCGRPSGAPTRPSGPARRPPAAGPTRSACTSRANCTTR
nr:hypothetical protein GCM10017745_56930 [Saccharothrix mutabilis subsp. capreolus]